MEEMNMASKAMFIMFLCSACLAKDNGTRLIFRRSNDLNFTEGFLVVHGNGLVYFFNDQSKQNYRNAKFACTIMGFKSVATFKNATLNDIEFKSHQYRVFIMNCTGEETNASQCPMKSNTSENQQHTQLLQISCSTGNNLRLIGGTDKNVGELQVLYNRWGSVCDDYWGELDANVACQQLGYKSTIDSNYKLMKFTKDDIILDNMKCLGNESDLLLCPGNPVGKTNCNQDEKVGIICEYKCTEPSQLNNTRIDKETDHTCDNGYIPQVQPSQDKKRVTEHDKDNSVNVSFNKVNEYKDNYPTLKINIIIPVLSVLLGVLAITSMVLILVFILKTKQKFWKRANAKDQSDSLLLIPLNERNEDIQHQL